MGELLEHAHIACRGSCPGVTVCYSATSGALHGPPQVVIAGQPGERGGDRIRVIRIHQEPVLPLFVPEALAGSAVLGHHRRKPGRHGLERAEAERLEGGSEGKDAAPVAGQVAVAGGQFVLTGELERRDAAAQIRRVHELDDVAKDGLLLALEVLSPASQWVR